MVGFPVPKSETLSRSPRISRYSIRPWVAAFLWVVFGTPCIAAAQPVSLSVANGAMIGLEPLDSWIPTGAQGYRPEVTVTSTQSGFVRLVLLCVGERGNSQVRSHPRNVPVSFSGRNAQLTLGVGVDPSFGPFKVLPFFSGCEGTRTAYLWAEAIPAAANPSMTTPVPGMGDRVSNVVQLAVVPIVSPFGSQKAVITMWNEVRKDFVNVADGRLMAAAVSAGYTRQLPTGSSQHFCVKRSPSGETDELFNSYSASRADNILSRGQDALGWLRSSPHDYATIFPSFPVGYTLRAPKSYPVPTFELRQLWRPDYQDNVVTVDAPAAFRAYGHFWSIGHGLAAQQCIESVEGDGLCSPNQPCQYSNDRPATNLEQSLPVITPPTQQDPCALYPDYCTTVTARNISGGSPIPNVTAELRYQIWINGKLHWQEEVVSLGKTDVQGKLKWIRSRDGGRLVLYHPCYGWWQPVAMQSPVAKGRQDLDLYSPYYQDINQERSCLQRLPNG